MARLQMAAVLAVLIFLFVCLFVRKICKSYLIIQHQLALEALLLCSKVGLNKHHLAGGEGGQKQQRV